MSPLLIALAVGIAAYVIIMIAVPKAAPEDKNANLRSALDKLYEENRAPETSQDVLREQLGEESALVRALFSLPFMQPLYQAAVQAGFKGNLQTIVTIMLVTFAVVLMGALVLNKVGIGFPVAVVLAYFVPYKYCKRAFKKRQQKFIDQFPDALDIIVRSVRSGFPLATALQMLAENTEDPIREEFRTVVDDVALGRTLPQALLRLSMRINEPDVRFFVVVLNVQQETGGNLSEIIGNLSGVIRKRKQMRHKIKALTSEGKATGIVLGSLPIVVFGVISYAQPEYLQPFFTDPMGNILLGGAIGLMGLCFIIVKQMISIDI